MEILGIDNVFFQVGDLEKAISFYEKIGFILKFKIPSIGAALLTIGKEEPGLMLFEKKDPTPSRLWVEVKSALEAEESLLKGSLIETRTGLTFEILDPWKNTIGFADYSKKTELARHHHNVLIRPMNVQDLDSIIHRFTPPWSTEQASRKIWDIYYYEHQKGIRTVAVLEKEGEIVGYGSLLRKSEYPNFVQANIPEVNSVWMDKNCRGQGLGTALIEWIENLALKEGYSQIGIGVGLYHDYGPAQKLYFQLGYRPDGCGITYKGHPTIPGESYPLDDDLILWLIKEISKI